MLKYSLEIDKINAEFLKEYLHLKNINFEPSACGNNIYFAINCTEEEAEKINGYIDELLMLDEMEKL